MYHANSPQIIDILTLIESWRECRAEYEELLWFPNKVESDRCAKRWDMIKITNQLRNLHLKDCFKGNNTAKHLVGIRTLTTVFEANITSKYCVRHPFDPFHIEILFQILRAVNSSALPYDDEYLLHSIKCLFSFVKYGLPVQVTEDEAYHNILQPLLSILSDGTITGSIRDECWKCIGGIIQDEFEPHKATSMIDVLFKEENKGILFAISTFEDNEFAAKLNVLTELLYHKRSSKHRNDMRFIVCLLRLTRKTLFPKLDLKHVGGHLIPTILSLLNKFNAVAVEDRSRLFLAQSIVNILDISAHSDTNCETESSNVYMEALINGNLFGILSTDINPCNNEGMLVVISKIYSNLLSEFDYAFSINKIAEQLKILVLYSLKISLWLN